MVFLKSEKFLFIILLFTSTSFLVKKTSAPYFQFDTVEHYNLTIDESVFFKESSNADTKDLYSYLTGGIIDELKDTTFLTNLSRLGYQKTILSSSKNIELNKLFSEKGKALQTVTPCEPMYRDILVFKRKKKIIGIAKICFECGQSEFIGTSKNTDCFGNNGEFNKLKHILTN